MIRRELLLDERVSDDPPTAFVAELLFLPRRGYYLSGKHEECSEVGGIPTRIEPLFNPTKHQELVKESRRYNARTMARLAESCRSETARLKETCARLAESAANAAALREIGRRS